MWASQLLMALHIAGICSVLKWWLPRQTTLFNGASAFYWVQSQRFKHEVGAVNFWTVQGESCPSSGHRSRPLQTRILSTFILPLSLSNAARFLDCCRNYQNDWRGSTGRSPDKDKDCLFSKGKSCVLWPQRRIGMKCIVVTASGSIASPDGTWWMKLAVQI